MVRRLAGRPMAETTSITATVGKPFEVLVEALGSAGYQWQLDWDSDAIELSKRQALTAGGAGRPSAVGASAKERLVFTPRKPGEFVIRMKYGRPWEATPLEQRLLRVRVT